METCRCRLAEQGSLPSRSTSPQGLSGDYLVTRPTAQSRFSPENAHKTPECFNPVTFASGAAEPLLRLEHPAACRHVDPPALPKGAGDPTGDEDLLELMTRAALRAGEAASRIERDEIDVGVYAGQQFREAMRGLRRVVFPGDECPFKKDPLAGDVAVFPAGVDEHRQ
jgi:hypothetical protein